MNAELRFPLIEAMLTPVGVLGGIRGVLFAGIGGGSFEGLTTDPGRDGARFKAFSSGSTRYAPLIGAQQAFDPDTNSFVFQPVYGPEIPVNGFRLVDSRASYGIGLETFALGFPVHFDWSWRTLFNEEWENARFFTEGGSHEFRKPQFTFWIGYDF
jgi:outer membrane protein assembly factor BamA